ncbi:MAG TPA: GIY-YIG nuclease family protein [Halobacteria archaeon]|jgi:Uri superfamily endonuclease|nr:GIY-YIG nuclease family protein [Halobacteria archaeon]
MYGITYNLLLENKREDWIDIGSLGIIHFKKGYFVYTGSAFGINGYHRIHRHLINFSYNGVSISDRDLKNYKRWWHIDYLKGYMDIIGFLSSKTDKKMECIVANFLSDKFDGIKGFGCSDCSCYTHLHYSPVRIKILTALVDIHNLLRSYN